MEAMRSALTPRTALMALSLMAWTCVTFVSHLRVRFLTLCYIFVTGSGSLASIYVLRLCPTVLSTMLRNICNTTGIRASSLQCYLPEVFCYPHWLLLLCYPPHPSRFFTFPLF
jgi:hypothetical protein